MTCGSSQSCEIFDGGAWTAIANMPTNHYYHGALTRFDTPNSLGEMLKGALALGNYRMFVIHFVYHWRNKVVAILNSIVRVATILFKLATTLLRARYIFVDKLFPIFTTLTVFLLNS